MSTDDTVNQSAAHSWTYPTLEAAHSAAIGLIGRVEEGGENSFHKYRYATASDIAEAVGNALTATGLGLSPIEIEIGDGGQIQVGSKQQQVTQVKVVYLFTHEGGQSRRVVAYGFGADSGEKGYYKAMTGAWKYLLRHLFCIATGEGDPENDKTPEQIAKKAHAEGRRLAIQALLRKGSHPTYSPQAFAKQLEEADAPKLADVRHFCCWAGFPKPSQRDEAGRRKLITGFGSDAGRALWQQFKAECLPLRD